jgi:3-carboxy-cis,cis-muconate cycloisomerase
MRAPGLVATLLGAMAHEHERAAGPWHAEWRPFSDLLETVGSAAAWLRDCLEHLEVDAARMRANLGLTHGALLAERVTTALAGDLGRDAAHEIVQAAARSPASSPRPRRCPRASTPPRSPASSTRPVISAPPTS